MNEPEPTRRSEPTDAELPVWLRPLVTAARVVRPADFARFLPPEDGSGRDSAVLIALGETAHGPGVLLIQRSAGLRQHPGQVAFPGGAVDPDDRDYRATALREAGEEVGLDPASVRPVVDLPRLFLPPSQFIVTPVLAWWERPHEVRAVDPAEVAGVAVVPIAELTDPANRFVVSHPAGWVGPGFEVGELFIWGFTAGLLDSVLRLAGWTRPWDENAERPLPAHLGFPTTA